MSRRKTAPKAPAPSVLITLTGEQAKLLREARDTEGGVYIGLSHTWGQAPFELVDGGAATWREVERFSDGLHGADGKPLKWTESYIVPTERGLALLERAS